MQPRFVVILGSTIEEDALQFSTSMADLAESSKLSQQLNEDFTAILMGAGISIEKGEPSQRPTVFMNIKLS